MFEIDSPFTMVVIIVFISILGGTINNWIKSRREIANTSNDGEMEALRREVFDLRNRVKTLERIVTDKETDLSREIERL
ncbi:hypothetical protein [Ponticaulis sp.]|uniref:hypothetical protein n=1 Tax=Ponticaulis sp. TaxID=2020902 RepID=UPI000B6E6FC6|nr:hypothetical protein [Ponticaulis sp.]MAI91617.1 hypothetical protein [Ponticaulis sp.]OUX97186.1 MAG: hypothetical protein CBB65_14345 [Hyphomonadaceae bacterium TMED5]|tara:strand:+ start:7915 stop:8151 length:237 start_codon:yes stop_codon:yes gene_type:complete